MKKVLFLMFLTALAVQGAETRRTLAECQLLLDGSNGTGANGNISATDLRDCLIASAAQGFQTIVSNLPAATAGNAGDIYVVTDGVAADDCTTGGGTSIARCQSTGTTWYALIPRTGARALGLSSSGGASSSLNISTSSSGSAFIQLSNPGAPLYRISGYWAGTPYLAFKDGLLGDVFQVSKSTLTTEIGPSSDLVTGSGTLFIRNSNNDRITSAQPQFDDVSNPLTTGGTYSGTGLQHFCVEIDAEGSPDTFSWKESTTYGDCSSWTATGVSVTGAAQTLADGVTITFGSTDGNVLGQQWRFVGVGVGPTRTIVREGTSQGTTNLLELQNTSGSLYTAFGQTGLLDTYNTQTTAGVGQPYILGNVSSTAQTAAITTTNLIASATAGLYRVSGYLHTTTASTGACTSDVTIGWTYDASVESSIAVSNHDQSVDNTNSQFSTILASDGAANITYAVSLDAGGDCTNAEFDIFIVGERIQ